MKKTFFHTLVISIGLAITACRDKAPANSNITFANTTDPICGMKVKPGFTDTVQLNGKVYGFCSESCRDEFKQNPEKYLSAAGQ